MSTGEASIQARIQGVNWGRTDGGCTDFSRERGRYKWRNNLITLDSCSEDSSFVSVVENGVENPNNTLAKRFRSVSPLSLTPSLYAGCGTSKPVINEGNGFPRSVAFNLDVLPVRAVDEAVRLDGYQWRKVSRWPAQPQLAIVRDERDLRACLIKVRTELKRAGASFQL